MNDTWAINVLRRQLSEQRNYLRLSKDQEKGVRDKVAELKLEVGRRQQMVDELEEAINILEGIRDDNE